MKKILIVDDQTLNQALLDAYTRQYALQHGIEIEITKANNGIEAVILCQNESYDLIFMDILMPVMNGIEATKHIHALLPQAIIVIVSTEGDIQNQIQALRNGAKDYFLKPIHPDVFKRRLSLYLSMITGSKTTSSHKKSQNPFTNAIFCYQTTYRIENEEDLAQLWESLLLTIKDNVKTNFLSDLIRFMFQLGQVMLSRKVQPKIILEENETHYFFTIFNVNILSSQKITRLIDNYLYKADYLLKSNLLSFKVPKEAAPVFAKSEPILQKNTPAEPIQPQSMPPVEPEPAIIAEPEKADGPDSVYTKETKMLQRFDFMETEDLGDLELKLNELSTQFIWMGGNELNNDDVDHIINAFGRISSILLLYSQTQELGIAIRDLATIIQNDEGVFIAMAPQMSTLCKSFNNDLIVWYKSLFFDGAPSIDHMDASILSNIQMIRSFLEPANDMEGGDDDGFEFF